MYTSFYQLNKKPFEISSDPSFMWFGEKHKEALATLRYGVLNNKGFLLLTGDVGTGKTTLINALIRNLPDDIVWVFVTDPNLDVLDFFNFIASSFGMKEEFATKGRFLIEFRKFLLKANNLGKKVLLIIDEAQLLSEELLEQIRLLSNIDLARTKLLNIFFIGQNEFNAFLAKESNRAVRQRLTLNYNIDPFTPDETEEYIKHRLKVAGNTEEIFTPKAVQAVHLHSGGFPRRINIICDHCLLSGYVNECMKIDEKIANECAKELEIPSGGKKRDLNLLSNEARGKREHPLTQEPAGRNKPKKKTVQTLAILAVIAFSTIAYFHSSFLEKSVHKAGRYYIPVREKISDILDSIAGSADDTEFEKNGTSKTVIKRTVHYDASAKRPQNQAGMSGQKSVTETPSLPRTLSGHQKPAEEPSFHPPGNPSLFTPAAHYPEIEIANAPVDETHSTEPVMDKKTEISAIDPKKIVIRFQYNTNEFSENGVKKMNDFAAMISEYPESELVVTGYTDSAGYKEYNIKLSQFRANIVKSYLMGKGIPGDRIHTRGLGSENPVESNETAWGRKKNRRVEIDVYQNDQ